MPGHPKYKYRKNDEYKNEHYLKWIRNNNCLICKRTPCDPHHVWCVRSSDYLCVPLCRDHHREYHDRGHEPFENKYGITFEWEIIESLSEYIKNMK